MSLLLDLTDIAEDLLFLGMKPPQTPARSFHHAQRDAAERIMKDSVNDRSAYWTEGRRLRRIDPRLSETADLMWQSIRLTLISRRLLGLQSDVAQRLGDALKNAAGGIFDAYCSLTPRWLMCEWLLDNPPPPPPWEATILHAVSFIDAGARIGGDIGGELQEAGARIIRDLMKLEAA